MYILPPPSPRSSPISSLSSSLSDDYFFSSLFDICLTMDSMSNLSDSLSSCVLRTNTNLSGLLLLIKGFSKQSSSSKSSINRSFSTLGNSSYGSSLKGLRAVKRISFNGSSFYLVIYSSLDLFSAVSPLDMNLYSILSILLV